MFFLYWLLFKFLGTIMVKKIIICLRFFKNTGDIMFRKEVNMLSGSIYKGLLSISLPIMIMNVVQSLFNIIDMTVLKTFDTGGGIAVGAVGTCSTLISLITGLLIGASAGANVVIARNIGAKLKEKVNRSIGTSLMVAIVGGVLIGAVGIIFSNVFLHLVNCPDELFNGAKTYFCLYFAGVPILMVYNFCAAILRSSGDSKRPMIYLILGGTLKILFNLLFVGAFRLGVVGVAVATIISWAFSAILAIKALLKNNGDVKINFAYLKFYKNELRDILSIGIPSGLQQSFYSLANVIITAAVNSLGPAATTGMSISNNFDAIIYCFISAPALSVMPYVSQNIGAKNIDRAVKSVKCGVIIDVAFGAFFGALSAIFSGQLASLMTDDPAIVAFAQQKMVLISSTYFICGINNITDAALKGMGKPLVSTVTTFIFMCVLRFVWVYIIYPLFPDNLTYLYLVWPVGWILCIATQLCFYFPRVKKLRRDFATSPVTES